MRAFLGEHDATIFRHDLYHTPGFDATGVPFDSVVVTPASTAQERVAIYSRGRCAGYLTLSKGDGAALARCLLGDPTGPPLPLRRVTDRPPGNGGQPHTTRYSIRTYDPFTFLAPGHTLEPYDWSVA